jgi:hypothetical protein
MRKKILLLLVIFSLAALSWVSDTQGFLKTTAEMKAERDQIKTEKMDNQQQRQEERTQLKEKSIEERCAMIQERIQNRIGNFDNGNEKHMAVYKNMVDRISKFIEKLSGAGYDTSKVKADLEVLEGMIAQFSADKDARLAKLNETKGFACGHSDGEFKAKLLEARKALQLVHQDAMDIRKYMLNTVRPDIQALKKQKVDAKNNADADTGGAPELE